MDDALVVFSARQIYVIEGIGPTSTGQGNDLRIRRICADAGCVDPRSVVVYPQGVLFQSSGGIYQLDRGHNLSYIGAPIQAQLANAGNLVTAAKLDRTRQRVYFHAGVATDISPSIAATFVFDYRHGAWTRWLPTLSSQDTHMTVWNDLTILCNGINNFVFQEAYGAYPSADPGQAWVTTTVMTPWIMVGGPGAWQRVRRISMEGDSYGTYTLTATVYNDFSTVAV